jgi:uncharacterized protein YfaS (alpha-2-macroglobulin family)
MHRRLERRHIFKDVGLSYSSYFNARHNRVGTRLKGTHVFEYAVRVQHRGRYETGLATIECMYAPEFRSHSASTLLRAE